MKLDLCTSLSCLFQLHSYDYIKDIPVCGKTGTSQNPHGKDHSVFFAFAPKENPQIAIAVFVENGGYGATYAAPIASLMIEKYLTGEVKRKWIQDRMLETDLYPIYNQLIFKPETLETGTD